jgi:hypothetical protein
MYRSWKLDPACTNVRGNTIKGFFLQCKSLRMEAESCIQLVAGSCTNVRYYYASFFTRCKNLLMEAQNWIQLASCTDTFEIHDWKLMNIVRKSCRKHFWIVSLMICYPLWSDKVMIVFHCWMPRMWCFFIIVSSPFQWCAQSTDRRLSEANLSVK